MRVVQPVTASPSAPSLASSEGRSRAPTRAQPVDGPATVTTLSTEAEEALQQQRDAEMSELQARLPVARQRAELAEAAATEARAEERGELSESEEDELKELRKADQEVRAHEGAHVAAAGGHAGSPRYKTVTGPDGKQYAVAGSVSIDMSPEATPEATAQKMQRVRAAATAVSDPSGADMRVAAAASNQLRKAQAERAQSQRAADGYATVAQQTGPDTRTDG